jgi:hypothetical protein
MVAQLNLRHALLRSYLGMVKGIDAALPVEERIVAVCNTGQNLLPVLLVTEFNLLESKQIELRLVEQLQVLVGVAARTGVLAL